MIVHNAFEGAIFAFPNVTSIKDYVINLFPTVSESSAANAASIYSNSAPSSSLFQQAVSVYGEGELSTFFSSNKRLTKDHPTSFGLQQLSSALCITS
jgi:hypothetical protein